MQLTRFVLLTGLLVVAISCVSAHSSGGGQEIAQADLNDWAERNYSVVLNSVLPIGAIDVDKFPRDVRWIVTVRIIPPFEKPEFRFSLQKKYDGTIETIVSTPRDSSILTQLRELKKKKPDAAVEQISSLVTLKHSTVTDRNCPQLSRLARELESLKLSPVLRDEISMDSTGYEFWSQALWGNRLLVRRGGPGPDAPKQPNPLLNWIEDARNTLSRSCPVSAGSQVSYPFLDQKRRKPLRKR
jgi:hypothetical protein